MLAMYLRFKQVCPSPPSVVTLHSTGDFAPELCMGFYCSAWSDDHAVAFEAESTLLKSGSRLSSSIAVQCSCILPRQKTILRFYSSAENDGISSKCII